MAIRERPALMILETIAGSLDLDQIKGTAALFENFSGGQRLSSLAIALSSLDIMMPGE